MSDPQSCRWWVVTDLDGTLMDHHYDWSPAAATLRSLQPQQQQQLCSEGSLPPRQQQARQQQQSKCLKVRLKLGEKKRYKKTFTEELTQRRKIESVQRIFLENICIAVFSAGCSVFS